MIYIDMHRLMYLKDEYTILYQSGLSLPENNGHATKWVNSQPEVTHDKTSLNQQKNINNIRLNLATKL